jgi:hypothetical protein
VIEEDRFIGVPRRPFRMKDDYHKSFLLALEDILDDFSRSVNRTLRFIPIIDNPTQRVAFKERPAILLFSVADRNMFGVNQSIESDSRHYTHLDTDFTFSNALVKEYSIKLTKEVYTLNEWTRLCDVKNLTSKCLETEDSFRARHELMRRLYILVGGKYEQLRSDRHYYLQSEAHFNSTLHKTRNRANVDSYDYLSVSHSTLEELNLHPVKDRAEEYVNKTKMTLPYLDIPKFERLIGLTPTLSAKDQSYIVELYEKPPQFQPFNWKLEFRASAAQTEWQKSATLTLTGMAIATFLLF